MPYETILRPSTSRTWPGSNGSIIRVAAAIRRIHLSDLITSGAYVFWTTMLGNFAEKSSAFCATKIAILRAISR